MSNEDGTNGHMEQIISWTIYCHVNELRIWHYKITLGKINEMVNNMLAITWAKDNSSNC